MTSSGAKASRSILYSRPSQHKVATKPPCRTRCERHIPWPQGRLVGLVIIDFSIERDDRRAVATRHRLSSPTRDVDNGETPMSESDPSVRGHPFAGAIRPPGGHVVADIMEFVSINR